MDGHPEFISAYRAELSGIILILVLYITTAICAHHGITHGSLILYCASKSALRNFCKRMYKGLSPFQYSVFDLIKTTQHLLEHLPIKVTAKWVKGHSTSRIKTIQEELNDIADYMAGKYGKHPQPQHMLARRPKTNPHLQVNLIYNNTCITSKPYKTIHTALHSTLLQRHIMKKAN